MSNCSIPYAGINKVLEYDANHWKTFHQDRLAGVPGEPGSLSLWGHNPQDHLLFSEHLTAEFPVETEGRGRRVRQWKQRPNQPDNHWLDCDVGTLVAASYLGAELAGTMPRRRRPRRVKLSELQRERRAR